MVDPCTRAVMTELLVCRNKHIHSWSAPTVAEKMNDLVVKSPLVAARLEPAKMVS